MPTDPRDWRAVVREVGNVGLKPAELDEEARTLAFTSLREAVIASADQILLYAWKPDWAAAVPAGSKPAWADEIDAAPLAAGFGRSTKLLSAQLWLRHADALSEIKPRVRWKPVDAPFPGLPKSAAPGDLLLRFSRAQALVDAVRSGRSAGRLRVEVVTRGASNCFSSSTWRMLRRVAGEGSAAPVHVGLLGTSRTLFCLSSAASLDAALDALAPLLQIE